jgi:F-type H+-transporting ATPase subunit alpha
MTIANMAVSLYAAERGYLDDIALEKIGDFEHELHNFMNSNKGDLIKQINNTGEFNDDIDTALKNSIEEFKKNHTTW